MGASVLLGLLIIAAGAFCQSSSYVPINKIKKWSWESYWLVQGVFAWLVFPLLGALLAIPEGHTLGDLFALMGANPKATGLTILFGALWGVGGLTFGLGMRYLGVALGQSIGLGLCSGLGAILGPVLTGKAASLTMAVIIGVIVTIIGIASIVIAVICGLMSACFNIGLSFGEELCFDGTAPLFKTLPATMLVTFGGFLTNACYCLYQNSKNKTFGDYAQGSLWGHNIIFCALAGLLWYSQFFGLSLGKGFLTASPVLLTFSWCILMSLNVIFSNVWGIILKEWKGCNKKTIYVLLCGLAVLIFSIFLPYIIG